MSWVALGVIVFLLVGYAFGARVLRFVIRRRLHSYRVEYKQLTPGSLASSTGARKVAVLGGGVAGLTAALTLARRGYNVTLFEKKSFLGGKLGSSRRSIGGGAEAQVSHGFHAFFPHYHSFNRLLDSLGLRESSRRIEDYVICERGGRMLRFGEIENTPVLNLFSLLRKGMFSLSDALKAPGRDLYGIFLEYDSDETFRRYDHISYAEFSRKGQVPPRLKLAFNTFARAFFADEEKLSLAQLVKAFHFYYLSHDGGLLYDYPVRDYEAGLIRPISDELRSRGAELRLGEPVSELRVQRNGFEVNGSYHDAIVCAVDPAGLKRIAEQAEGFSPSLRAALSGVRVGQRYAVWRLWLDRDLRSDLPVFVITERDRALDAVTLYHRFEEETQKSLKEGEVDARVRSVIELHCYAVPDDLPSEQIRDVLLAELKGHFEELRGAAILHEAFQVEQDFTAFHVGLEAGRPEVKTELPGFYLAGDWVKLPFPAMLLEASAASGYLAANGILAEDGLAPEPIFTVPGRGLMAGLGASKARRKILGLS